MMISLHIPDSAATQRQGPCLRGVLDFPLALDKCLLLYGLDVVKTNRGVAVGTV